jgi:DNA excision repair protein ERCC-1
MNSAAEAGRYIETFKAFEHANSNLYTDILSADSRIKQHQATDYPTRLIETLTTIRSVNKNDAVSLVANVSSSQTS